MRKVALIVLLGILVVPILGASSCETESGNNSGNDNAAVGNDNSDNSDSSKPKKHKKEKDNGPDLSASQENALETAQDYLSNQGFSKKGLIQQLKFEGYSKADATFAVNHVSANWNEQAVRVAKDYLDSQSFSQSALVEQLKFDGFSQSEAEYGVKKAYH